MNSLKQQLFGFTAATGLYFGILALMFPKQLIPQNAFSVGMAWAVFMLSALITSTGSAADGEANARKFLLATTVQMLLALFYVLIARYAQPHFFKGMAIHFLGLFFVFLVLQVGFLIRRIRQAK